MTRHITLPDPSVLVARARLALPDGLDAEQLALAELAVQLGIIVTGEAVQTLLAELGDEAPA